MFGSTGAGAESLIPETWSTLQGEAQQMTEIARNHPEGALPANGETWFLKCKRLALDLNALWVKVQRLAE